MRLFAESVDLCTSDGVVIDRVQAYLRAYLTALGVRWGGELIPEEDCQPAPWPDGELILKLPSGQTLRATITVVRAGTSCSPEGDRIGSAAVGFHQIARVEGLGPPPAECGAGAASESAYGSDGN